MHWVIQLSRLYFLLFQAVNRQNTDKAIDRNLTTGPISPNTQLSFRVYCSRFLLFYPVKFPDFPWFPKIFPWLFHSFHQDILVKKTNIFILLKCGLSDIFPDCHDWKKSSKFSLICLIGGNPDCCFGKNLFPLEWLLHFGVRGTN